MSQVKEGRRSGFQAIVALLCALVLALGTTLPSAPAALADDETTPSITVSGATSGDTYYLYQLFTGSFSTDGEGNTVMGDATVNSEYEEAIVKALYDLNSSTEGYSITGYTVTVSDDGTYTVSKDESVTDTARANALMDAIHGLSDPQAFANVLAGLLASSSATSSAIATDEGTVSFSGLGTGYYLVAGSSYNGDVSSAILLPVDGAETATIKTSTPTATKAYTGGGAVTTTTGDDGGSTVSASAIGYTVTGTVASNVSDYDVYYYAFQDTLPAGVSASLSDGALSNITWSVAIGDTDVTSSFSPSVSTVTNDDGSTQYVVTWACSDLTAIEGVSVSSSSSIVLTYSVTLSSSEVETLFGSASEDGSAVSLTNSAAVIYSNNPYSGSSSSTGESTASTDTVYWYTLQVSKVDSSRSPLSGAVFRLTDSDGNVAGDNITADSEGSFVFTGLQAGTYTLTETTTPDGYKSIDPITFTISETTDETTGEYSGISASEDSDPSSAAVVSVSDGTVTITVTNTAGVNLPVTGQQGIMLGLLIGAAVIAVSCAAIARNRRKDAEGAHAA